MQSNYVFIFLVFIFSYAGAQTRLDSLYGVLEDSTLHDSIRSNAFKEYIVECYPHSPSDSVLILAHGLFQYSGKEDYQRGMARALNYQGLAYFDKSEYPEAMAHYQMGLKISQEIGDKNGVVWFLIFIAHIYEHQEDFPKALDYYQRALKIREEIGDKDEIGWMLVTIAHIYSAQGNFPKAHDYLQRFLKIVEEKEDKVWIADALTNIALNYKNQGDYPKALDNLQRALRISEEIGDTVMIALRLINIGQINADQDDYPKALSYYQQGLKIQEEIGDKDAMAWTMSYLGAFYLKMGNYIKAISYCKKGFDHFKNSNNIHQQKESCKCLYDAYKAQGNGSKALVYLEQMQVLDDSLQTKKIDVKLQQMEFAIQVQADSINQVEKDLKLEMAHRAELLKKDRNKNLAIGAGLFFLFVAGGYYIRWRYVKKSKAVIEKEKDRSESLLLNILPAEIAEELKLKGSADARTFDMVSVLFADFEGFTRKSAKLSAEELIGELNDCFRAFDQICEKYRIEKIKTIGDAYMAAGGLPVPSEDSVRNAILAAIEMESFVANRIVEKQAKKETIFEMRIGIHTGPVVAGIVGVKKFQYDIWGDTVNTASRMESNGEIDKVNISQHTYDIIKDDPYFTFEKRGKIRVKGKGELEMYFVSLKHVA
ncbi:MAG: tetratricopeptide repeat protein [Eudoraea sp.]|uniref:tetratricopeptide repeat protein n=1 Tax=Eudoraea sp. TaxID=1979955 RepID=UPI0032653872